MRGFAAFLILVLFAAFPTAAVAPTPVDPEPTIAETLDALELFAKGQLPPADDDDDPPPQLPAPMDEEDQHVDETHAGLVHLVWRRHAPPAFDDADGPDDRVGRIPRPPRSWPASPSGVAALALASRAGLAPL